MIINTIKKYLPLLMISIVTMFCVLCKPISNNIKDFEICGFASKAKFIQYIKVCNIKTNTVYICQNPSDMQAYLYIKDSMITLLNKNNFFNAYKEEHRKFIIDSLKVTAINNYISHSGEMEAINYIFDQVRQTSFINLQDTTDFNVKMLCSEIIARPVIYTDIVYSSHTSEWQQLCKYYHSRVMKNSANKKIDECLSHNAKVQKFLTYISAYNNNKTLFYCLHYDYSKKPYSITLPCMDIFIKSRIQPSNAILANS
jgi:hypothetical protein